MDADEREETPGSETKRCTLTSQHAHHVHIRSSCPQIPRGRHRGAHLDSAHAVVCVTAEGHRARGTPPLFKQPCSGFETETFPHPLRLLGANASLRNGQVKKGKPLDSWHTQRWHARMFRFTTDCSWESGGTTLPSVCVCVCVSVCVCVQACSVMLFRNQTPHSMNWRTQVYYAGGPRGVNTPSSEPQTKGLQSFYRQTVVGNTSC